jgi:hypothetical protein
MAGWDWAIGCGGVSWSSDLPIKLSQARCAVTPTAVRAEPSKLTEIGIAAFPIGVLHESGKKRRALRVGLNSYTALYINFGTGQDKSL